VAGETSTGFERGNAQHDGADHVQTEGDLSLGKTGRSSGETSLSWSALRRDWLVNVGAHRPAEARERARMIPQAWRS
jgi:hypothetical protein